MRPPLSPTLWRSATCACYLLPRKPQTNPRTRARACVRFLSTYNMLTTCVAHRSFTHTHTQKYTTRDSVSSHHRTLYYMIGSCGVLRVQTVSITCDDHTHSAQHYMDSVVMCFELSRECSSVTRLRTNLRLHFGPPNDSQSYKNIRLIVPKPDKIIKFRMNNSDLTVVEIPGSGTPGTRISRPRLCVSLDSICECAATARCER